MPVKIRNHLARLVAGALLASSAATAVALAPSSAHAASTLSVTATLEAPSPTIVQYGDTYSIEGYLKGSDGGYAYRGNVSLQELDYGSHTWRTIQTKSDADAYFYDIPATISGSLRIYYAGYKSTDDYEPSYSAAVSAPVSLRVARKLTVKTNGLHVKGKVSPAHGKMKIVFKVKKGKHYKKWFKVTTKKNGKFKKTVPHEKIGTKVLVMIPGGQGYTANVWYGQYY